MRVCALSNTTDLGVLVVRNLLFKLLREKQPDAHISVLAEHKLIESTRSFYESGSWVDECISIDAEDAATAEQRDALRTLLTQQKFDTFILSPGSGFPVELAYEAGIRTRVGLVFDESRRRLLTHPVTLDWRVDDPDLHWTAVVGGYAKALGLDNFRGAAAHVPFVRFVPTPETT